MRNATEEFLWDTEMILRVIEHRLSGVYAIELNNLQTARPVYHEDEGADYVMQEQDMYKRWYLSEGENITHVGNIDRLMKEILDEFKGIKPEFDVSLHITFNGEGESEGKSYDVQRNDHTDNSTG